MSATYWYILLGLVGLAYVGTLVAVNHYLKPFFWRFTFCLTPLILAGLLVGYASELYAKGEGGFRLGVDLVGGTILVYEVDLSKFPGGKLPETYRPEQLAASLKRRIDPADLYNVTIRPVSDTRVEIILPTGGKHQAEAEEAKWEKLLQKVETKWPAKSGTEYNRGRGKVADLIDLVSKDHPETPPTEIADFINANYTASRDFSNEQIQQVKEKISQVGLLEFRILANARDDRDAVEAAKKYLSDPQNKDELDRAARAGQAPPSPQPPDPDGFNTTRMEDLGKHTYTWVELGRSERYDLGLDNAAENDPEPSRKAMWDAAAKARNEGKAYEFSDSQGQVLIYSRKVLNPSLLDKDRDKKFEYFMLVRDPQKGKEITGKYLVSAYEGQDKNGKSAVSFHFNREGGDLFYEVTSKNAQKGGTEESFKRRLAIVLDQQIMSAPNLNEPISTDGEISGHFTKEQINNLINILRAGALPATLKPQPVSENTMGATLGEDTIIKGTIAVGLAFFAILIFMIVYYRFAGLVASVALLANLLLTVAFMVAVKATFTLPGLAGLVLMLGMAVDANVLIYERLREERERGASLALAIRNGYDRAFPTIIDTHLSSIFTAIVLYAVGNDQLKGFGVSLTVGLLISLFTSLYVTRFLFDLWLSRGWLHKLSMAHLKHLWGFRRILGQDINFMGIRYYWFTATILLTLFGISVFVFRLPQDLNIDFNGGTAYGGQLTQEETLKDLRAQLGDDHQKTRLAIKDVTVLDPDPQNPNLGHSFEITYADNSQRKVELSNLVAKEEVQDRARQLPDLSVELIFPGSTITGGNQSSHFTIRTSEKAPDLVQAAIARLVVDDNGKSLLQRLAMTIDTKSPNFAEGKGTTLEFIDPATEKPAFASPSQVTALLDREFKKEKIEQKYSLSGKPGTEGTADETGRFTALVLTMHEPVNPDKLKTALEEARAEFDQRPTYDRLENFDSQLAAETQMRAMWAILASWAAILLYLWFRFGSWTFGMAAVLCLIHDLFFTMGIIAFCHFIYLWTPWLARILLIEDFKIDLPSVAALLTLVGYSVNDTIVVFDRIREVRGKNPELTPQMINDSVNQTLSRTLLTSFATWLVVVVLYIIGGEGVHLFAFCMVVGVVVGTYSSIYIASPLLLIFGEGAKPATVRQRQPQTVGSPG